MQTDYKELYHKTIEENSELEMQVNELKPIAEFWQGYEQDRRELLLATILDDSTREICRDMQLKDLEIFAEKPKPVKLPTEAGRGGVSVPAGDWDSLTREQKEAIHRNYPDYYNKIRNNKYNK